MTPVDFGLLSPEVNSGRMYAGPGAGPMMAAASAWDGLAAQLNSAASSYQAAVSELTDGPWQGPSAASMLAAAAPYVQWMATTAAQAEQTAGQARAAAAAYGAAFAATVPPPVIATNRAALASLVAANVFGQNTPAIAANQAEYAEMWAQDAEAMYGYAGGSAAAAKLTTFTAPPQNTNPATESTQPTAPGSTAGAAANNPIQSLIDGYLQIANLPLFSSMNQLAGSFGITMVDVGSAPFNSSGVQMLEYVGMLTAGAVNGTGWGDAAAAAAGAAPAAALSSASSASVPAGGAVGSALAGSYAPVSAGLGRAASISALSVPQSWAQSPLTSPAIRLAATALPGTGVAGAPAAGLVGPGSWTGHQSLLAGAINTPRTPGSSPRHQPRVGAIPNRDVQSGAYKQTPDRWVQPSRRVADVASSLTAHERRELEELRKAVGGLTRERDAAARLIRKEFRR